uniref:Centrin-2 n=2 Tax=Cacopsylla melanoneura TaxID=428564 RepID=A0A8D9BAX5_9HEMI
MLGRNNPTGAGGNFASAFTVDKKHIDRLKPSPLLQLTERQVEELREAFNIFDTDGTGFISVSDFKIALKALGFEPDKQEIRRLLWGGDANAEGAPRDRSGGITFNEFQNIMSEKMNQVDTDTDLERAFELFDDDETGSISLRNLRRIARQLGENISEDELQEMLDVADRRGVGEVSLEDFKHVMKKGAWAK